MIRTLFLCALVAASAAGCAGAPAQPKTAATRSAASDRLCVQASRIPHDRCGVPGDKWSGNDLERTGQNNPGDALSFLDPSVQVHH